MNAETSARGDVRRPLWRGSQMVRALWFDCTLLGEDEARRRLLGGWETGARAHRVGDGYLLAWKSARRLQCEGAGGLPLCDQDGVFASAPLLPAQRTGIASGSAVLVLGAHLHVHALNADTCVDPSLWLDMSAVPVCVALALPVRSDPGFADAMPQAAPDVRSLLGDAVPPPSPDRAAFIEEATRAARNSAHGVAGDAARGATSSLAAKAVAKAAAKAAGAAGLMAGLLLAALARLPGRQGGAAGRGQGAGPKDAQGAGQSSQPKASALGDWLAARAAKLAAMTRIAGILGWRQANYLRKMLQQFEEGDLDEALRHAIPLDSPDASTRQAFGLPGRRDKLELGAHGSASSIGLDEESVQLLRKTYQRSFDMLDRAGRIDEAVFVLAELMNRRQEAVDYLERKGRVAQAAQLAETLQLPAATAVRLYAKAGDLSRAVLLARLRGCFAEAVGELERRRDPGAQALRLEWALDLAARGSLPEAALAVWPLTGERVRALDWLYQAEQGGGALGVQGLLYMIALDPETLRARNGVLQALLWTPGPDAVRQRLRACECLLGLDGHNDATRRIAAALWRVLAAERSAGRHAMPGKTLARLLKLSADPVLAEDMPRRGFVDAPAPRPLVSRDDPLRVTFAEDGLYALMEVRVLPEGGYLLALGEGGVVLAREAGRAPVRFPVPADYLVVAENGRRALALAGREKVVRVSRIDLVSGKVEDWFSADLRFWADRFDGATWSVVVDERLMVLDATAQGQSVLWQISDLPGKVVGFEQEEAHQALLMQHDGAVEQWRYALPARRLLARTRVEVPEHAYASFIDCSQDTPLVLGPAEPAGETYRVQVLAHEHKRRGDVFITLPQGQPRLGSVHDGLLLMQFDRSDADGSVHFYCQLLDARGRVLADILLPDARQARATVHSGRLLAWDRRGRVVEIDLATSAVRTLTFS